MQRVLVMLVAAVMGSGCAGVHIVRDPAPWHDLEPGHRVRVHLFQPRNKVVGYVVRLTADTLVINSGENARHETSLSTANIRRLELSRGLRSRKGRGALVGLLLGAAAGSAVLAYFCSDSCIGAWPLLGLIPGGVLVGAGIGAGVGSLTRTERWQAVSWR
jgi:hypothetical protein